VSAALIVASTLGNTVEQIGAYGGLASMIGLGVLALLYFAQAREVKRLREWAGRAPERASEVEQRVQIDAQRRVIAQPQTAAGQVAATPAGAAPAARLPAAGLSGEAATRAAAAAIVAARASHPPAPAGGAPGQLARPSSPTGTPPPAAQPGGAAGSVPPAPGSVPPAPGSVPPARPAASPAGAVTPAPAKPDAPAPPVPAPANQAASTPTTPAALTANRPTATASSPPAAPAKGRVVAHPPAAANGGGQETRESAAARPLPPPPPPGGPTGSPPPDDGAGSHPGRTLAIIGGALGLVLVVGLIVMLLGGSDSPPSDPNPIGTAPAVTPDPGSPPPSTRAGRGDTTTTVLNGTTQAGLASTVQTKLTKAGFKKGDVADNVDQTLAETAIYYTEGNERAAKDVAKVLGVSSSAVQPEDRNVDVATSGADVVVTVGADLNE